MIGITAVTLSLILSLYPILNRKGNLYCNRQRLQMEQPRKQLYQTDKNGNLTIYESGSLAARFSPNYWWALIRIKRRMFKFRVRMLKAKFRILTVNHRINKRMKRCRKIGKRTTHNIRIYAVIPFVILTLLLTGITLPIIIGLKKIPETDKFRQETTLTVAASNAKRPDRYDIKCNGTNDQITVFSTAMDELPAGGGKIALSEGQFNVQGTYTVTSKDNFIIEGCGYATLFNVTNHLYFDGCTDFTLRDFKMDGNNQTGICIQLENNCENVHIEGVWVYNGANHAFGILSAHDVVIRDCVGEGGNDDNFAFGGTGTYNCSIIGCIARNAFAGVASSNGIEIDDGPHDITVEGNICYNNAGGWGINVHSHADASAPMVYNITITGNTCIGDGIVSGNSGAATYLPGRPREITISDNTIVGATLAINRCYRHVLEGNIIKDSPTAGISIGLGSNGVTIGDNDIYSPASYGMNFEGNDVINVTVSGNIICDAVSVSIRYRTGTGAILFSFNDNVIIGGPTNAVHISKGRGVDVADNIIADGNRVYVDNGDGVTVDNNVFDGGYIYIAGGTHVVVSNNIINDPSSNGIYTSVNYTKIKDNTVFNITGGGRHGIVVTGDNVIIDGNEVDDTANGHGIDVTGANCRVTYNICRGISGGAKYGIYMNTTTGTVIGNTGSLYLAAGFTGTVQEEFESYRDYTATTTDDTVTTVGSVSLADTSVYYIEATILARETDGSNRNLYHLEGLFYREGGGATQQDATTTITEIESAAAWDCVFDVNVNDVRVRCTGAVGDNVNWMTALKYWKVG